MDTDRIISELQNERDRINQAIDALKTLSSNRVGPPVRQRKARPVTIARRPRRLSAAGRKRLSELMKQRWAERRRRKAA
jgi:hypothetical protein